LNTLVNLESASPGFDGQFSVGVNSKNRKDYEVVPGSDQIAMVSKKKDGRG
jgi:hypothetical protein